MSFTDNEINNRIEDNNQLIKKIGDKMNSLKKQETEQYAIHGVMARASYNKYRGWDVNSKKVVKYAYVEKDGAVMRANGYCVGNYEAGDFLLHVP